MTLTRLRDLCLALPGTTEQVQWGNDLVFKVGGKMFCVTCADVSPSHQVVASFKCDDETFGSLVEREGIIPAPYLARAKWVGLCGFDALEDREYRELIPRAHALVLATLPKKVQAALAAPARPARTHAPTTSPSRVSRDRTGRDRTAEPSRRKRA